MKNKRNLPEYSVILAVICVSLFFDRSVIKAKHFFFDSWSSYTIVAQVQVADAAMQADDIEYQE